MFVSIETVLPQIRELKRVDHFSSNGWLTSDVDYGVVGDNDIVLPALRAGERYVFYFSYIPLRVSPFMSLSPEAEAWRTADLAGEGYREGAYNKNVLDIPDELAEIIPYFVFGELYMHDEPTVAMYQGTNKFEAYLSQYVPTEHVKNDKIKNIFGGFN